MTKMNFDNARNKEQIRRMKSLQKTGVCHFCRKDFEKKHSSPIIREEKFWFITKNDFPYDGVIHHYLIVSKRHITKAHSLLPKEWSQFGKIVKWLSNRLHIKGYSLFVRSGEMKLTGATLDHLHFQFIVGGPKPKVARLKDAVPVVIAYKKKNKK